MVIRTLIPGAMLMLLFGAQTGLPSLASADCCPCYNSCAYWCQCRGTPGCGSCRAGESDLFQGHAIAITPQSDFSATQGAPPAFPVLTTINLSDELVAIAKKGSRRIGDTASRLLAGAEYRIKSWCPGALDKSV